MSSNYPCLEHIFMVPNVFGKLKFYCKISQCTSYTQESNSSYFYHLQKPSRLGFLILMDSGLPLIIHFKIPRLYPDILQFSIPSVRSKKSFLLYTLMVLTVSLHVWGLLLKERLCSPREQILAFMSSPQCGGRWA